MSDLIRFFGFAILAASLLVVAHSISKSGRYEVVFLGGSLGILDRSDAQLHLCSVRNKKADCFGVDLTKLGEVAVAERSGVNRAETTGQTSAPPKSILDQFEEFRRTGVLKQIQGLSGYSLPLNGTAKPDQRQQK